MGYGSRNNGQIKTFWPDDSDNEFYLAEASDLEDIISMAEDKWPGITIKEIRISSEYIHTDCLTYDMYDGSDYTNFIAVSRI